MSGIEFCEPLKCDLPEIGRLITKLESFGEDNSLANGPLQHVVLVLDELLTNVISYGYPDGGESNIIVRVALQAKVLHVTIEDDGVAFDPLHEAVIPDVGADIEDRGIGGLGVHIAKTMMDDIGYQRVDGKNQLRFQKFLG